MFNECGHILFELNLCFPLNIYVQQISPNVFYASCVNKRSELSKYTPILVLFWTFNASFELRNKTQNNMDYLKVLVSFAVCLVFFYLFGLGSITRFLEKGVSISLQEEAPPKITSPSILQYYIF